MIRARRLGPVLGGLVLFTTVVAAPASASHVLGGRYRGTVTAGGDVFLQVSSDGTRIAYLSFTGAPCFDLVEFINGPEITDHSFSSTDDSVTLNGSFTSPGAVQGTVRFTFNGCDSGTSNWSANLVHSLRIDHVGSGSGEVAWSDDTCGHYGYDDFCFRDYPDGTPISLSATADYDSTFDGWSGDCTGTGTCNLTMSSDHAVTAAFSPRPTHTLSVTVAGQGSGYVSGPAGAGSGIFCGEDFTSCTEEYLEGATVSLSPHADYGSSLAGWSGACTGTGSCKLTMSSDRNVTATFGKTQCVVPNVKGKRAAAAANAVFNANCMLARSRFVYSAVVAKNRVISQKPAPGTHLPFRGKVYLVISKGKRPSG